MAIDPKTIFVSWCFVCLFLSSCDGLSIPRGFPALSHGDPIPEPSAGEPIPVDPLFKGNEPWTVDLRKQLDEQRQGGVLRMFHPTKGQLVLVVERTRGHIDENAVFSLGKLKVPLVDNHLLYTGHLEVTVHAVDDPGSLVHLSYSVLEDTVSGVLVFSDGTLLTLEPNEEYLGASTAEHHPHVDELPYHLSDTQVSDEGYYNTTHSRARRSDDLGLIVFPVEGLSFCSVFLDADKTFYKQWGGDGSDIERASRTIMKMIETVHLANAVLQQPHNLGDRFGIFIAGAMVHTELDLQLDTLEGKGSKILRAYQRFLGVGASKTAFGGASKMVRGSYHPTSQEVCLNHLFTHSNLNGLLGVATLGKPSSNSHGGICAQRLLYNDRVYLAANTGLSNTRLPGGALASTETLIHSVTHELAHNMGADHTCCSGSTCKPSTRCNRRKGDSCNPNLPYLMFPRPSRGQNSLKLSPCSLSTITSTIEDKGHCLKTILPCDFGGPCCDGRALRAAGTVCRPAIDSCHGPAVCNGRDSRCPANPITPTKSPCTSTPVLEDCKWTRQSPGVCSTKCGQGVRISEFMCVCGNSVMDSSGAMCKDPRPDPDTRVCIRQICSMCEVVKLDSPSVSSGLNDTFILQEGRILGKPYYKGKATGMYLRFIDAYNWGWWIITQSLHPSSRWLAFARSEASQAEVIRAVWYKVERGSQTKIRDFAASCDCFHKADINDEGKCVSVSNPESNLDSDDGSGDADGGAFDGSGDVENMASNLYHELGHLEYEQDPEHDPRFDVDAVVNANKISSALRMPKEKIRARRDINVFNLPRLPIPHRFSGWDEDELEECAPGRVSTDENTCTCAQSSCARCVRRQGRRASDADSICLQCTSNKVLRNNQCEERCPQSEVAIYGMCHHQYSCKDDEEDRCPCSHNCMTCGLPVSYSSGDTVCQQCRPHYFLLNGNCVLNCPPGYMIDTNNSQCVPVPFTRKG